MKEIKMVNNVATINADVFIIPNSLTKLSEFLFNAAYVKQLAEANNISVEDTDYTVQLWWTCPESANICDHGIKVVDENGKKYYVSPHIDNLPVSMMKDVKEGDQFTLNVPASVIREASEDEDENFPNISLVINATAKQLNYRYMRFGRFEDVLNRLQMTAM